ncbi:hypothetical protein MUZ84_002897 [Salmonella enterica]|uniref:hypothetical protein n=1 Tax=Klebsiella variicola TaxID=244366 RepID=UPI002D76E531|nr:hypothetical protein [Klebsiella variicola]EJA8224457.1 hypothetical protein [Salmonella enterica]WRP38345.1 hypothetical protein U1R81_03690 [Klebsiella variicola]HAU6789845.1 hypothetical protein [Salmonella enterica subsp. enterica serovar Taiping]
MLKSFSSKKDVGDILHIADKFYFFIGGILGPLAGEKVLCGTWGEDVWRPYPWG